VLQHWFFCDPRRREEEEQGQVIFVRPGAELDHDADDWVFVSDGATREEC
jgi:hypothetical protein